MIERALVFTDVVDSTRLVERLGDARAAEVWAAHDRRARELLARHRGREIDRTDGFFLMFDARRMPRASRSRITRRCAALALAARVGLHVGPVTLRENSPQDVARGAKPVEVEGVAKPLAARVMALAQGGQLLVTRCGARGARRRAPGRRAPRVPRSLSSERHRGAGRHPRDRRGSHRGLRAAARQRQGLSRRARGRLVVARAPGPAQPAGRARQLRRSCARAARSCRPPRRGPAPDHGARPGRHGQDALRAPLRPGVARRLAGRRVLLRPVRGALARRDLLRRRLALDVPLGATTPSCSWDTPSPAAAAASSSSTTSSRWSSTPPRRSAAGSTGRRTRRSW